MKQPDLAWVYELYLLGQKAAHESDSRRARTRLLRHIVRQYGADSGSLSEIDDSRSALTIIAGIDIPDHVIGSQVPVGSGILGWVAQQAEPLLLNGDLSSDPRFNTRLTRREGDAPRSALCWPLLVEGQPVGVISLNRGPERPPFTIDDLREGFNLIRFVAIAVENVRLHARSARYVRELRGLMKQQEETALQLMQTDKMASIGQLSAGVAHEINNPITYIASNLATLRDYVEDLIALIDGKVAGRSPADAAFLRDDVRALISESEEGVSRVRNIVSDLRDFSHVNEDRWARSDLHAGLDSTLNIVSGTLGKKADIVRDYGALPFVECMMPQLNQVFMNVLINASDAIRGRGTITIRTGVMTGATTGEPTVFVEISDTGKGMTPLQVRRIFEPFFTTKPVGKGTGLGLPLSWRIVEKHRGRIVVDSRPGEGSTFRIEIPVARAGDAGVARASG